MDITRPEDKINIANSLLKRLCHITIPSDTLCLTPNNRTDVSITNGKDVVCDVGNSGYLTCYSFISGYECCRATMFDTYICSNVLSATPILHGGRIYIEVVLGYLGKKYIDPSVCGKYNRSYGNCAILDTRCNRLPEAFVDLPDI